MAMVTIKRGSHTTKVSQKAFENIFKNAGYTLVGQGVKSPVPNNNVDNNADDGSDKEIDSIPISEMNKSQLAEYAKKHNIDTTGATNVKDARKIIQEAIQQAKM